MAPDFDDPTHLSSSTRDEEITADTGTLREWLNEARNHAGGTSTSDSIEY